MSYRSQLYPWCIIRKLPNLQSAIVIRFRRRSEAENCLQNLKRINASEPYEIVFDVPIEQIETTLESQLEEILEERIQSLQEETVAGNESTL